MVHHLNQSVISNCVRVESGTYNVGSDTIPQAGPRHPVYINTFWIDVTPVSLAHLEVFIASGGYFESRWWSDLPRQGTTFLERGSVDKRCIDISLLTKKIAKQIFPLPRSSRDVPATGITWMEAAAVCRFFGGRLPFEAEWEVAMQTNAKPQSTEKSRSRTQFSSWGCQSYAGLLEEWTAGAFTTRHWRGEESFEIAAVDAPYGVCIRGSTRGSLFTDPAYRSPGDPLDPREFRGFRRVWTEAPSTAQLSADF